MELLSQHALIAVALAGACGTLFGWLVKKRSVEAATVAVPPPLTPGFKEMKWRHEKLVLTERQQVEKQARLDAMAEHLTKFDSAEEQAAALRIFVLAERVREARQKVGSDLSRMRAVRDRLDEITASGEKGREALGASRGMAEAQAMRLGEAREILRDVAEDAFRLETAAAGGSAFEDPAGVRRELVALKGAILALPQGWLTAGDDTDARIRELLATIDIPDLTPVREVLMVDGSLTESLAGTPCVDLPGAARAAITALDRLVGARAREREMTEETGETEDATAPQEVPPWLLELPNPRLEEDGSDEEMIDFGFPPLAGPDTAFREGEFSTGPVRIGGGFHDLTLGHILPNGEAQCPDDLTKLEEEEPALGNEEASEEDGERELVLFCSNDVELWGKTVYRGARCRARAIAEFPAWARWISVCRLDTGERVFAPIRTASLRNGHAADPFGFNGTNELFYGARHLGLFSESCPNEVETRFTYGGWGFGHRSHEIAPEVEQLQAAGWEGREIPADTVFEIVIHEELPALGAQDRLLEGEVCGSR